MSLSVVVRDWILAPVVDRLTALESRMADISGVLVELADQVRGPLQTSVQALIAERDALAAQVASQSGEEVAESAAVGQVRDAVDGLAGILNASPDAPDVEPIA